MLGGLCQEAQIVPPRPGDKLGFSQGPSQDLLAKWKQ